MIERQFTIMHDGKHPFADMHRFFLRNWGLA